MSQNQEGTEILFEIVAPYSYVENDSIIVPLNPTNYKCTLRNTLESPLVQLLYIDSCIYLFIYCQHRLK